MARHAALAQSVHALWMAAAAVIIASLHTSPVHGAPISSKDAAPTPQQLGNMIMTAINLGGGTVGGYMAEPKDLYKADTVPYLRKFSVSGEKAELISPPELRDVLRNQMSSKSNEGLSLRIPVEAGVYTVHLVFAELWDGAFTPGARVFDIRVGTYMCGEQLVAKDFDVYSAAGNRGYTGVVQTIEKVATRGGINIRLKPKKQNPILNAVVVEGVKMDTAEINMVGCAGYGSVLPEGAPTATTGRAAADDASAEYAVMQKLREQAPKHALAINVGSAVAVGPFESDHDKWWNTPAKLENVALRRSFSVDEAKLAPGQEHGAALRTQIASNGGASLDMRLPVAPGVYKVHMLFAELWDGAFTPGMRVFDIRVNTDSCGEKLVKAGMDVFSEAGQKGYTGVVETVQDVTAREYIDLKLVPKKQNAVLNAVWVEGVELSVDEVKALGCSLVPSMVERKDAKLPQFGIAAIRAPSVAGAAAPPSLAGRGKTAEEATAQMQATRTIKQTESDSLDGSSASVGLIPEGPIFLDMTVV
ncbi:hypothetical protein FVE85_4355 [Porphyridium purpureum]|uniref:Malectin domain-containing protein n=1 Tax=Porphyridium purpureum TaxID=35688 RepID=A0A5J4YIW7_PORPP|nr:hypothetical protein FVE85_4355 [Porphyridium purpureum]|eukprot:POR2365..scf270_19